MLRTLHIHEDLNMKVDMHVKPGKGIMFYFQMHVLFLLVYVHRTSCVRVMKLL